MMKAAAAVLLLCLLAGVESRNIGGRELSSFNVRAACSAGAILKITVTEGRCDGFASANCEAVAQAYSETKKSAVAWEAEGICESNSIATAASALATVLAKVFVKAAVKVSCTTGDNSACGYSFSDGKGEALAISRAIAQAFADADPDKQSFSAFCAADLDAIAKIYTEVVESARAAACTNGGFSSDIDVNYERSMRCALANAYARAAAEFCIAKDSTLYGKQFAAAKAASECSGSAEVIKFNCD